MVLGASRIIIPCPQVAPLRGETYASYIPVVDLDTRFMDLDAYGCQELQNSFDNKASGLDAVQLLLASRRGFEYEYARNETAHDKALAHAVEAAAREAKVGALVVQSVQEPPAKRQAAVTPITYLTLKLHSEQSFLSK